MGAAPAIPAPSSSSSAVAVAAAVRKFQLRLTFSYRWTPAAATIGNNSATGGRRRRDSAHDASRSLVAICRRRPVPQQPRSRQNIPQRHSLSWRKVRGKDPFVYLEIYS